MSPTQANAPADPKAFTGWHMLGAMLAFFGVVIAANLWLALSSSGTWTGMVVENSYVASQEFQDKLEALRAQQALGWEARFAYEDRTVLLAVRGKDDAPVDLGVVTVRINRPIGTRNDLELMLTRDAEGVYSAPAELAPGVWEIRFTAETSAGPFELHERFVVGAP